MKILLLTTHLNRGGISVYVTELARDLKRSGHQPMVASAQGWLGFPRLLLLLRRQRPDLLYAHTGVTQGLAWTLSALTQIPYVTTSHEFYRAPSPETVASFKQTIGLTGKPVVGVIARFNPAQGLDALLQAIPRLLKVFPRLQLLLVGDGPTRSDLVRLAYQLGIAEHVVITHPVDEVQVPLAAMDVFVAPSFREGSGCAIVEAMAAGVPVASDQASPIDGAILQCLSQCSRINGS